MQTQITIDIDPVLKDQVSRKVKKNGFSLEDPLIEKLEERMLDSSLRAPKIKEQLVRMGNML